MICPAPTFQPFNPSTVLLFHIVVGFLWLPGQYVVYGNGVEIGRLESGRICNVPSYVILYMVSGGWANVPIEDETLPDEFQIDWIRVWQKK